MSRREATVRPTPTARATATPPTGLDRGKHTPGRRGSLRTTGTAERKVTAGEAISGLLRTLGQLCPAATLELTDPGRQGVAATRRQVPGTASVMVTGPVPASGRPAAMTPARASGRPAASSLLSATVLSTGMVGRAAFQPGPAVIREVVTRGRQILPIGEGGTELRKATAPDQATGRHRKRPTGRGTSTRRPIRMAPTNSASVAGSARTIARGMRSGRWTGG